MVKSKKCLWCLKLNPEVTFLKKAHTIPKSLGGEFLNPNVCDECNYYFGNRDCNKGEYSIEEALKETFSIPRKKFLFRKNKRKVGRFKSKFFEVKNRNGKYRLTIKPTFKFTPDFQKNICRSFKRGLYKMYFEELNRQKKIGYENKFNAIRDFARYDKGDLPVVYFHRKYGVVMMLEREAESPKLLFDRMKYLISNDKFAEIEFFGLVFGFPISPFNEADVKSHYQKSMSSKKELFSSYVIIKKLTDIDFTLSILDK